jgi:hypothetical protein
MGMLYVYRFTRFAYTRRFADATPAYNDSCLYIYLTVLIKLLDLLYSDYFYKSNENMRIPDAELIVSLLQVLCI